MQRKAIVKTTEASPKPAKTGPLSPPEPVEVFREDFTGTFLSAHWQTTVGQWTKGDGFIHARAVDEARLMCTKPLPENFRVSFEARGLTTDEFQASDLNFNMCSEDSLGKPATRYGGVVIGGYGNSSGEFRQRERTIYMSPKALVIPNEWMSLCVEFMNGRLRVELNNELVLDHREPFLPSYELRCRFSFSTWHDEAEFRNVVVWDLGNPPLDKLANAIRNGDQLYQTGQYSQAWTCYTDQLQSGPRLEQAMELRYKIGASLLQLGSYDHARGWLNKVVAIPRDNYWEQQAKISLLESDFLTNNYDSLLQTADELAMIPGLRDQVRSIVINASADSHDRGFYQRFVDFRAVRMKSEDEGTAQHTLSSIMYADALQELGKYEESEAFGRHVLDAPHLPSERERQACINLAYACIMMGKSRECNKVLDRMFALTQDPSERVRCQTYRASGLRGAGKYEEALQLLRSLPIEYEDAVSASAFAMLNASQILCGLGKPDEAKKALSRAVRLDPKHPYLTTSHRAAYFYPPHLVAGEYSKAAQILFEGAKFKDKEIAIQAEHRVKAGIVLELAGKKDRANRIWSETIMKYPLSQCCHYAQVADELRTGDEGWIEQLPYPGNVRSELFYLCSLLFEKRGNAGRARKLLEMSVESDLGRRWPAALARTKLGM